MAGKFLKRDAIVNTIRNEQATNAIRKRKGLSKHPVETTPCGCPDPHCGAFHTIVTERTIPTVKECETIIINDNKARKKRKKRRNA